MRGKIPFAVIGMAILFGIVLVLFGLPPWSNKYSYMAQYWATKATGLRFHRHPQHPEGVYRIWDGRGRLVETIQYKNGVRHGRWVSYDSQGVAISIAEYREGKPWNGMCRVYAGKAWIGEYRDGQPWNGYLPVGEYPNKVNKCFIDGNEVTEPQYREHHKIPANADIVPGLGYGHVAP